MMDLTQGIRVDGGVGGCGGRHGAGQRCGSTSRPRARDLGIAPGAGSPGAHTAITFVAGGLVGHTTLIEGDRVRTGVTAIVPHGGNLFREKVPGAVFVGNAFGKLAGSTQVRELGTIETPIILTNTLSVGAALDGLARWTVAQAGNENAIGQRARRRNERRHAQ
jgi:D-aminopeptidase